MNAGMNWVDRAVAIAFVAVWFITVIGLTIASRLLKGPTRVSIHEPRSHVNNITPYEPPYDWEKENES